MDKFWTINLLCTGHTVMQPRRKTKRAVAKSSIAPMAITQTSPPTISGVLQVGQTLTANSGEYSVGEGVKFVWSSSENGGSDWFTDGEGATRTLQAADVARVYKVTETVSADGEEDATFESAKTKVVMPADATVGTVTVTGPSTGEVGVPVTYTASISGDAEEGLLTYGWEIQGGDGQVKTANVQFEEPTANPATVTFSEPGMGCKVVAWVATEQTNVVDSPQSGFTTFDSQVPPPEPEPGAPLERKTDTVLEGLPFVGEILTIVDGTAQGGTPPYTTTYEWQRSSQGDWQTINGYVDKAYSPGVEDGGYSIRGVTIVTDKSGAELKLPSLGTTPVVEQPDEIAPDSGYSSWAQYNIASLIYNYRNWHLRDLTITQIDNQTFTVTPAGRLDDLSRVANPPTDGEIKMVWDWIAFRWTGSLEFLGEAQFKLSCMGSGRFVPSGGASASIVGDAPTVGGGEEE